MHTVHIVCLMSTYGPQSHMYLLYVPCGVWNIGYWIEFKITYYHTQLNNCHILSIQNKTLAMISLAARLTLSLASGLRIIWARCAMAPASTTVCASSGECLQMSLKADAAMRFSDSSGSYRSHDITGCMNGDLNMPRYTTYNWGGN